MAPTAAALPGVGIDAPSSQSYPTLCSHGRTAIVQAYLDAWGNRRKSPGVLAKTRPRLLAIYAGAYAALRNREDAALDQRMRLLWDLDGLAHATGIPPIEVKRALRWTEPKAHAAATATPVAATDAARHPILIRVSALPAQTRIILKGVPAGPQQSFWDYVAGRARQAYLTAELHQWSPGCSLDVCGSSEPLSRTLILAPVSAIDLQPKPAWSLAAVAVHESAHIEWFHRPEVSRDPRLLLPVPNERHAWRAMSLFLQGLLHTSSPAIHGYARQNQAAIREELLRARRRVERANRILGLHPGDMSVVARLPRVLRGGSLRSMEPALGR